MNQQLKYVPIFRGRQQELIVLRSFNFGSHIYPCLEIVKELDRAPSKPKQKQGKKIEAKKEKKFEDVYLPLLAKINADKVFVDLPVHLRPGKEMKPETILFLTTVVSKRDHRTEYILKLKSLSPKVIPVISTFSEITGERQTILLQEGEIRKEFNILAFRTFPKTFARDLPQIKAVTRTSDYLIMDWGEMELDLNDEDQLDIVEDLKKLDCTIINHRNPFPLNFKIADLRHGEVIETINNSNISNYKDFAGTCFSDYVGIKKDNIGKGGIISPGFIYYDAVMNNFCGFRFKNGSHKKGEKRPELAEFETTIIPSVITCDATKRMSIMNYLGYYNVGWRIIQNIERGESKGGESGKNAAKFKRISMEHYLHCLKTRIENGDFNN